MGLSDYRHPDVITSSTADAVGEETVDFAVVVESVVVFWIAEGYLGLETCGDSNLLEILGI